MNNPFLGSGETRETRTGHLVVLVLAVVVSLLALVLVGLRDGAVATESRAVKKVVLGKSGKMPDPACPKTCQVIASVSVFQRLSPTGSSPFRVPFKGRITGYTLHLGKPTKRDRRALNGRFGSPPQAAISVLKRIKTRQGAEEFQLLRKSPVEGLSEELGTIASFRLDEPLAVAKGQLVALSVPTWAPVFAIGLSPQDNKWRASREPRRCSAASIDSARPQLKVKTKRVYGCTFSAGRILYTVNVTSG